MRRRRGVRSGRSRGGVDVVLDMERRRHARHGRFFRQGDGAIPELLPDSSDSGSLCGHRRQHRSRRRVDGRRVGSRRERRHGRGRRRFARAVQAGHAQGGARDVRSSRKRGREARQGRFRFRLPGFHYRRRDAGACRPRRNAASLGGRQVPRRRHGRGGSVRASRNRSRRPGQGAGARGGEGERPSQAAPGKEARRRGLRATATTSSSPRALPR